MLQWVKGFTRNEWVDDDEQIRVRLRCLLEATGYQVTEACDGYTALAACNG